MEMKMNNSINRNKTKNYKTDSVMENTLLKTGSFLHRKRTALGDISNVKDNNVQEKSKRSRQSHITDYVKNAKETADKNAKETADESADKNAKNITLSSKPIILYETQNKENFAESLEIVSSKNYEVYSSDELPCIAYHKIEKFDSKSHTTKEHEKPLSNANASLDKPILDEMKTVELISRTKPSDDDDDDGTPIFHCSSSVGTPIIRQPKSSLFDELKKFYPPPPAVNEEALLPPVNGFHKDYTPQIVLSEPNRCNKFLKFFYQPSVKDRLIRSSIQTNGILTCSVRPTCTPQTQYKLNSKNQYTSQCLILKHQGIKFKEYIKSEKLYQYLQREKSDFIGMSRYFNTAHFHDLEIEKLKSNQIKDFLHRHTGLTGEILSSYVDWMFSLSEAMKLKEIVIHTAINYLYIYLNNTENIPEEKLEILTIGCILIAIKMEIPTQLEEFYHHLSYSTKFGHSDLKKAELMLMIGLDMNFVIPNPINFRDRYIYMQKPNVRVNLLSNFILDMTVHCYSFQQYPASLRAAVSVWLSNLMVAHDHLPSQAGRISVSRDGAVNILESIWPSHMSALSNYSVIDFVSLAFKMHIILLVLLRRGRDGSPYVKTCYEKYSTKINGYLSQWYPVNGPLRAYLGLLYVSQMLGKEAGELVCFEDYRYLRESISDFINDEITVEELDSEENTSLSFPFKFQDKMSH